MRRKQTCIFVLSIKPSAALKLLEQFGCPNTYVPKNDFCVSPFNAD